MPFRFLGVSIGARMTIVRLSDGKLFVHSPIELSANVRSYLNHRGNIKVIVSPNNLHHLFMADYFDEYPYAKIFASPGLKVKRKDLHFTYELEENPDPLWKEDLDQTIFYGHENFHEVVFFHAKSQTLILADLIMNFVNEGSLLTKMATKVLGIQNKPSPPLDFDISASQKMVARKSVERILQWNFDKIILSHGRLIESNGKEIFKQTYSWLME